MNLKIISAYLIIPVVFASTVFIYAITNKYQFSADIMMSVLVKGYFFYSAPYFLWAFLVLIAKVRKQVTHIGFIGLTIALLLIASVWLGPRDPSGLPIQWMLYWPLAGILLLVFAGATTIYLNIKAPNKKFNMDSGADAPPPVN